MVKHLSESFYFIGMCNFLTMLRQCIEINKSCCFVSLTRLLIYGQYCSHMENAQKTLDELIATREEVKIKVEVMSFSTHPQQKTIHGIDAFQ